MGKKINEITNGMIEMKQDNEAKMNEMKQDSKAKMNEMKQDYEAKINLMNKDYEAKMNDIKLLMKEELRKSKLEVSLDFTKNELQKHSMDEKKIEEILQRIRTSKKTNAFDFTKIYYKSYQNCANYYCELNNNNEIIILFKRIIGKKLKSNEEKNAYKRFIDLLNNKKKWIMMLLNFILPLRICY